MPRGASPKREREYRELKEEFEESGRYRGREAEVASRIVNKQRREYGETKPQQAQKRRGASPDRDLPIAKKLTRLDRGAIRRVKSYEESHKARKTLIEQINRRLKAA
ncbi:MAG: hypothetical protein ACK5AZ_00740 [Bryobacteraceae bacterium]